MIIKTVNSIFYFSMLLIILFSSQTRSANAERYKRIPRSKKYQTRFVTASGLKVMTKPSVSSRVVMILPYGTRISVRTGLKMKKINKDNINWYYCREAKGYVYGRFLNTKAPVYNTAFIIRKIKSNDGCSMALETLSFSNMKVIKTVKRNCKSDVINYTQNGTYQVRPGYLAIVWEKTQLNLESRVRLKKHVFTVEQSYQQLYYVSNVGSWIDGELYQSIKHYLGKCQFIKQGCYYDCSGQFYNRFKKEYNNTYKWDIYRRHYFFYLYCH